MVGRTRCDYLPYDYLRKVAPKESAPLYEMRFLVKV
jgi:hypothetical protein